MKEFFDVAVIGGGAAGLCAAVRLRQTSGLSVVILEKLSRVGKKLGVTGNGQCNITNTRISRQRYHGEHTAFTDYALENYDNAFVEKFFGDLGVLFTYDNVGRVYPYSLQASSVSDALRFATDDLGITTYTDSTVSALNKTEKGFELVTDERVICAKTVIVAAGLRSGEAALMADSDILRLLKNMGYPTVKMSPSIVQLRSNDEQNILKQLSGIKVRARATLMRGSEKIRSEFGEVMFRDYGLSGPAIMQLAREVGRRTGNYAVYLDLMPEYDFETLWHMLSRRAVSMSDRTMTEFLTGMLNKRPGQVILKLLGFKLSDRAALLTEPQIKQLANLIKNLRIDIFDTADFKHSQVTAGGLDTGSFDDKTMMSKRDAGLFAAGEILDIDGDCGGFNLQWAWSSACCAADGVVKYFEKTSDNQKENKADNASDK